MPSRKGASFQRDRPKPRGESQIARARKSAGGSTRGKKAATPSSDSDDEEDDPTASSDDEVAKTLAATKLYGTTTTTTTTTTTGDDADTGLEDEEDEDEKVEGRAHSSPRKVIAAATPGSKKRKRSAAGVIEASPARLVHQQSPYIAQNGRKAADSDAYSEESQVEEEELPITGSKRKNAGGKRPMAKKAARPASNKAVQLKRMELTFDDRVVDICVGQAVFLVLREGDLDSDRLDENDLGIALVKSITGAPKQGVKLATSLDDLDDPLVRIQWLYRPSEVASMPDEFKTAYQQRLQPHSGTWELVLTEHFDDVSPECIAEPPLVYYFRDHVDDMSDALKPLFPPLDGNAEDFVNAHASNINVQTGGSDAIVGAWYYRATMAPFSSKKAGASKLNLRTHCTCKKPYDPSYVMRRCHDCQIWYHDTCLGDDVETSPGDKLLIRGAEYGLTGNFGLIADATDDQWWRSLDRLSKEKRRLFRDAKKKLGKVCPGCQSVI